MHGESLKSKTVKGVAWSGIDNVTQFGVGFVVSIVLARLLSPDDYGLIGIIAIFTAVCNSLIYGGFGTALIRKAIELYPEHNMYLLCHPMPRGNCDAKHRSVSDLKRFYSKFGFVSCGELLPTMIRKATLPTLGV